MVKWFPTKEKLGEGDVHKALRMLVMDGVCSQVLGNLTGGVFLVAFALYLGASNAVIGLLSAMGPLTQILQLPAIFLVEKVGNRRSLVVLSSLFSRLFWFFTALIPFMIAEPYRLPLVVLSVFVYFALGSISGCAFNSWLRDVVPESSIAGFLARRMSFSMAVGVLMSVFAAVGIDRFTTHFDNPITLYSVIFCVGATAGWIGVWSLSQIPEPRLVPSPPANPFKVLSEPFHDTNFRKLLIFLGSWNFAVNLAAPFYTVYMIKRNGLSVTVVLGLTILSQVLNVFFFHLWGRLADRFSNKSVLAVAGPMVMISIVLWPLTTTLNNSWFSLGLLMIIHALAGISTAGVTLCTGGIALRAAPRGRATAYLATNSLVSGSAATIAPILAGLAADGFDTQHVTINLQWISELGIRREFAWSALHLHGLDFLFLCAFIFGLYALHRLIVVQEEGEVDEKVILFEFYAEIRKVVRHVSSIAGLRTLTYFPYARLRELKNRISNR